VHPLAGAARHRSVDVARIHDTLTAGQSAAFGLLCESSLTPAPWLDLDLFRREIESTTEILLQRLPLRKTLAYWRRDELISLLGLMDEGLRDIAHTLDGAPILYSRPVYEHLQERYQLNGKALDWGVHNTLTPVQLDEIDRLLLDFPAGLLLADSEPDQLSLELLAERGIVVVVFRPMLTPPETGDFSSEMVAGIARLKRYLAP